jgi:hypothetical protein
MLLLNNRHCNRHLQTPLKQKKTLEFCGRIERYHQMLIDMKKIYRRNAKAFVKATKQNLNRMHFTCILAPS